MKTDEVRELYFEKSLHILALTKTRVGDIAIEWGIWEAEPPDGSSIVKP